MDFWVLALSVAEVAAIAAGVEIIIAILRMRAPGMTLGRMPRYAWAMLVTAFMILFAFTPLQDKRSENWGRIAPPPRPTGATSPEN